MKTLFLMVMLLTSVSALAQEKLSIVTITTTRFSGAVQFPLSVKGDQAVVRVFYWTNRIMDGSGAEAKPVRLLLSREFVIPVLAGTAVMFDEVPAPVDQIENIEVTLLARVSQQDFRGSELHK